MACSSLLCLTRHTICDSPTPGTSLHCLSRHPLRPPLVVTGSSDGIVSIWDLKMPGRLLNSVRGHSSHGKTAPAFGRAASLDSHRHTVWDVSFHDTEPQYLFSAGDDGNVLMWDFNATRNMQEVRRAPW